MGRIFLEHLGGIRIFSCASCDTYLTNRSELISTRFTGATGRAFLFHRVVNLEHSDPQERVMLTGRHIVRDVSCKVCKTKLGWIYEFATEEPQRYKEGRIILERALVTEADGFEEHSEGRIILERALVTEADGFEEHSDDDSNRTQDHGSPHSSGGVSVEDNNSGSGAVLAHALISAPIAQAHAVQHGSAHMAAAAAMLQHAQQAAFNVLHHGPPPPPPRL